MRNVIVMFVCIAFAVVAYGAEAKSTSTTSSSRSSYSSSKSSNSFSKKSNDSYKTPTSTKKETASSDSGKAASKPTETVKPAKEKEKVVVNQKPKENKQETVKPVTPVYSKPANDPNYKLTNKNDNQYQYRNNNNNSSSDMTTGILVGMAVSNLSHASEDDEDYTDGADDVIQVKQSEVYQFKFLPSCKGWDCE